MKFRSEFNNFHSRTSTWKYPIQHIGQFIVASVCYISSTQVLIYVLLIVVALANTLSPRQNERHFPDDVYNWIFLSENAWISIKISLKFVPGGPINNIPALVRRQAIIWTNDGLVHWRKNASLDLKELTVTATGIFQLEWDTTSVSNFDPHKCIGCDYLNHTPTSMVGIRSGDIA